MYRYMYNLNENEHVIDRFLLNIIFRAHDLIIKKNKIATLLYKVQNSAILENRVCNLGKLKKKDL